MVKVITDVKPEELKYHFVFLEQLDKDGKVAYESGEYLITAASPSALYVTKPKIGYDFSDGYISNGRAVVGSNPWKIVQAVYDKERLLELLKANYVWGAKGGKQWVGSLYSSVKDKAALMLLNLGENLPNIKAEEFADPEKTIIAGRADVLLSKRMRLLIGKVGGCSREAIEELVERIFFELGQ